MKDTELRIAALILASAAPRPLGALVRYLAPVGADVFVHLDAKSDIGAFLADAGERPERVRYLKTRRHVYWAGFSMVEATLDLLAAAIAAGPYDKYLFLSDNTLPTAAPERLMRRLAEAPDLMIAEKLDPGHPYRHRCDGFFLMDRPQFDYRRGAMLPGAVSEADEAYLAAFFSLRARGKRPLPIYYGQANWALSHDSVVRILDAVRADPWLVESCRFSAHSDEFFFHSILCAAKYPDGLDEALVHTRNLGGQPRDLVDIADLPLDMHPHFCFMRKASRDMAPDFAQACVDFYENLRAGAAAVRAALGANMFALLEDGTLHLHLFAPAHDAPEWHGRESLWGRRFRWSQADVLRWPLAAAPAFPALKVTLSCVTHAAQPLPPEACVEIGGRRAPLVGSDRGYVATFTAPLPASEDIFVHAPTSPADPGRDERRIGLALATVPEF